MSSISKDEELLICNKAVNTFGQAIQKVVAMEECAELISAVNHKMMERENNIEEEIADVEIMCSQLSVMYNLQVIDSYKISTSTTCEVELLNTAIEVLSNLQKSISKSLRDRENNVEQRLAETIIMCVHLREFVNEDKANRFKQEKLNRLKELVW